MVVFDKEHVLRYYSAATVQPSYYLIVYLFHIFRRHPLLPLSDSHFSFSIKYPHLQT